MSTEDRKRACEGSDTAKQAKARACRRHLQDLRNAYERPLPDVAIASSAIPVRISPVEISSFCTSSAELCADLVK